MWEILSHWLGGIIAKMTISSSVKWRHWPDSHLPQRADQVYWTRSVANEGLLWQVADWTSKDMWTRWHFKLGDTLVILTVLPSSLTRKSSQWYVWSSIELRTWLSIHHIPCYISLLNSGWKTRASKETFRLVYHGYELWNWITKPPTLPCKN